MTISSRTTELNVPGGGGGSGSGKGQAGQDGEGQEEFVFQISKDEYLDLLLEDLALPNLKQNRQRQLTEYKTHRAVMPLTAFRPISALCVHCRTHWRDAQP
ncbi:DUF444 family protein [Shigella boydii]